jgi:hypothetical protein
MEWANISHQYLPDVEDFMPLCHSHHSRYDPHRNRGKTHCPKGHPYDTENTVIGRRGSGATFRICLACKRVNGNAYTRRKREVTGDH